MNKLLSFIITSLLVMGLFTSCGKKFDENLQKEIQAEQAATEAAVKTTETLHSNLMSELKTAKLDAATLQSNNDKMKMHMDVLSKAKEQISKNAELIAKHEKKEMSVEDVKKGFEEMKTADAGIMNSLKSMNADHDVIKAAIEKAKAPVKTVAKPAVKGRK